MKLDTVTLEVIRNALPAVANEMAADVARGATAPCRCAIARWPRPKICDTLLIGNRGQVHECLITP